MVNQGKRCLKVNKGKESSLLGSRLFCSFYVAKLRGVLFLMIDGVWPTKHEPSPSKLVIDVMTMGFNWSCEVRLLTFGKRVMKEVF